MAIKQYFKYSSLLVLILSALAFSLTFSIIGNADDLGMLHMLKKGEHIALILNYFTAWSLALLYLNLPSIPWFSLMLFVFFIFGFTVKYLDLYQEKKYLPLVVFIVFALGNLWSINITSLTVFLTFCGIDKSLQRRHILVLCLAVLLRVNIYVISLLLFSFLVFSTEIQKLNLKIVRFFLPCILLLSLHYLAVYVDNDYQLFLEQNYSRFLLLDQPRVAGWKETIHPSVQANAILQLIKGWHLVDPRVTHEMFTGSFQLLSPATLWNIDNFLLILEKHRSIFIIGAFLLCALLLTLRNKSTWMILCTAGVILIVLLITRDRARLTVPLLGGVLVFLFSLTSKSIYEFATSNQYYKKWRLHLATVCISIACFLTLHNLIQLKRNSYFVQWTGCYDLDHAKSIELTNLLEQHPNEKFLVSIRLPCDYRSMLPIFCRQLYDESMYGLQNLIFEGWTIFTPTTQAALIQPFDLTKYSFLTNDVNLAVVNRFVLLYRQAFNECYLPQVTKRSENFHTVSFNRCDN